MSVITIEVSIIFLTVSLLMLRKYRQGIPLERLEKFGWAVTSLMLDLCCYMGGRGRFNSVEDCCCDCIHCFSCDNGGMVKE